ncbi:hypothetical protein RHMOL_Rhmol06G0010900 [Rhododendron molle]|uniref:Uncharacterized protein n=1 Tax=Rhododendron molle TaxID=49168 RepID=A0ACC0N8Q8_RHOML|nr:hypothetical protein RHMOL_Rhmol06G0010900 [Rhododendron molle]
MASVWCLNSHGSAAPFLSSEKPYRLKKFKRSQVLCCGSYSSTHLQNSSLSIQCQSGTIIRRQVLFQTIIAAFSFPPIVSIALADTEVLGDFRLYSDEANKFKIMIPQGDFSKLFSTQFSHFPLFPSPDLMLLLQ